MPQKGVKMKASKLLEAIELSLAFDQGAIYRGHLKDEIVKLTDAFSTKEELFRGHLGCSLLGRECDRALWYSFHWYTLTRHSAKMVLLFNRGHMEEARFVAILKTAGIHVQQHHTNGKQIRVEGWRKHGGGSTDGVVYGVPDDPTTWMVVEMKTHGDKSFTKLKEDGVQHAKYEHFIQMQMYAGRLGLTKMLYVAINKNTDEIWAEIIQFDPVIFARYENREKVIIEATAPPPKYRDNPKWQPCRFCDHVAVCHEGAVPYKSCRTCQCSAILDDGKWGCMRDLVWGPMAPRTQEQQLEACSQYVAHA